MSCATDANCEPLHHVNKMAGHLNDAAEHLRQDALKVDDPLFKAMFASAAQVLDRLVEAFRTYESNTGQSLGEKP
jgi:hypothetical protein